MADISKLRLPSGNTYDIKDETARTDIATLQTAISQLTSATKFIGETTTALTDGATTSTIVINGSNHTAAAAEIVVYSNKEFIFDGSKWIEFGDLSNVKLNKGSGDNVLGEATTFTVTQPTITPTKTTRYIKGTASGAAVGADGTATAVTGLGTPSANSFVKAVTKTKKKLATTSIYGTAGTVSVNSADTVTQKKLKTTSVPNVTAAADKTLSFEMGSGNDSETLIISGTGFPTKSNTYTASQTTLGTAIKVATGETVATSETSNVGATITESVTTSSKTCATRNSSATTVATGSTVAESTTSNAGATVVEEVSTDSDTALTSLGTPTTETVLTGVKVTAQPTITLAAETSSGTGKVAVLTNVTTAASGAAVTVGTNDIVKVAKYDDLSISAQ